MIKTKRIQLDFSEEAADKIEQLMRENNVKTKRELFNMALSLLSWALKEKREGKELASFDKQTKKYAHILLPI